MPVELAYSAYEKGRTEAYVGRRGFEHHGSDDTLRMRLG